MKRDSESPSSPPETQRPVGSCSGSLSITNRIACFHIVAVAVTFSVCAGLLYIVLERHLCAVNDRTMNEVVAGARTLLAAPDGVALLGREAMKYPQREPEVLSHLVRLVGRNGEPLVESRGMRRVVRSSDFPPGCCDAGRVTAEGSDGKIYLLKSLVLDDERPEFRGRLLQVALDVSDERVFAQHFAETLAGFVLCGFISALLGARMIVRRGLKPVAEIDEAVQRITENRLHTRIDPSAVPVEMAGLVGSFNSMLGRLEESFGRLTDYTANLAHELRTPLSNLMMESDIALSRPRSPEEYRKVIGSSMEEYERLSWLVERLLFLARADGERSEAVMETVDAGQEVAKIAGFYDEVATSAGIRLLVTGEAVVAADRILFCRAVSNLVDNALTHTESGGIVALAVIQRHDLSVEVAVSDTGCGIPAAELLRVFDRFHRVGAGPRERREGAGLGLAIVKAIMEMHGGTVALESKAGKGTTATLRFPAALPAESCYVSQLSLP